MEAEKERLKDFLAANEAYVKTCENSRTIPGRARGRLINISNCRGVILGGIDMGYAPSWNVHFIYSRDVVTYGCSITSRGVWNGDGWDPDSSEDCTVFDTEFNTHDNAIAIKSGKNPEGNLIGRPTKNIRIFDCRGHQDIAIGSELSGGVDGVYIWDCHFFESWGINIKTTADRGGYVKNIRAVNSALSSITIRTRINCNNDGESAGYLTKIENLHCENLVLQGVFIPAWSEEKTLIPPISIDGFPDKDVPVENVTVRNVKILPKEDGDMQMFRCRNVRNITMENIDFE